MHKRPPIIVDDVTILLSGEQELFHEHEEKSFLKPMPALAYRGNEPLKDITKLPSGVLSHLGYGLAFFAVSHSKMTKGEVATEIGAGIASSFIPFGGLLIRRAASAVRRKEREEKLIEEALKNPDSFIVPYWQISRITIDEIGGILSKRRYLVIEREQNGTEETFYVLLEGHSRDELEVHAGVIWALRPWSLVEPLSYSEVRKIIDIAAIQSDESLGGDATKMAETLDQELAKKGMRLWDIQMDLLHDYEDVFAPPMEGEREGQAFCWNMRCQNQEPLDVGGHCPACNSYIRPLLDSEEREGIRTVKELGPDHPGRRMLLEYPLYVLKKACSQPDGEMEINLHTTSKELMLNEQREDLELQPATVLYADMFDLVMANRLASFSPTLHRDIKQAISDGLLEPVQRDLLVKYVATERLKIMDFKSGLGR